MDRKILEKIAEKYCVTPEEIQKEMETALGTAAEKKHSLVGSIVWLGKSSFLCRVLQ